MDSTKELERSILSTFSDVANSIGYSSLHGKIIGILLVENKPLSLQELARKTQYSLSMISLSIDFLEVLGVIKKIKRTADRNLYIELCGDLLECLKKAFLIKLEKSINESLNGFEKNRKQVENFSGEEKEKALNTLNALENEIKRLERYVKLLSGVKLP